MTKTVCDHCGQPSDRTTRQIEVCEISENGTRIWFPQGPRLHLCPDCTNLLVVWVRQFMRVRDMEPHFNPPIETR